MTPDTRLPTLSAMMIPKLCLALGLACSLPAEIGCASSTKPVEPAIRPSGTVTPVPVRWSGWDAYQLKNDEVGVLVVPATGRIMSYHLADVGDSGNVLWKNARAAGELPQVSGEWQNFGGDKAWPWPQQAWENLHASAWPPPVPFEGVRWTGEIVGDAVKLSGPVATEYGIRPTRTIALDRAGSGLTITTTFERADAADGSTAAEAGVWHVTQVPRDGTVLVAIGDDYAADDPIWLEAADRSGDLGRFVTKLDPAGVSDFSGGNPGPAWSATPLDEQGAKAGFDASTLAAGMTRRGRPLAFVQYVETATPGYAGGRYLRDGDRAQLYSNGSPDSWSEMEFTAPVGRASSMTVRWLLEEVRPEIAEEPARLAALGRDLARADRELRRQAETQD